jgi:hypothetical protein
MHLHPTIVRSVFVLVSLSAFGCSRGYESAAGTEGSARPGAPATAAHNPATQALPSGHPTMGSPTGTPGPAPTGAPLAGGLTWTATAPLVARAPGMEMRAAEYGVAGEGGAAEAVLTVFHFGAGAGGTVQDNIDRWAGMYQGAGGAPAVPQVAHLTVSGFPITTVATEGTAGGGMPGAETAPALAKFLGAIVEGPEGMVFFKLSGPPATVDRARAAFDALIASIVPAAGAAAAPAAAAPAAVAPAAAAPASPH